MKVLRSERVYTGRVFSIRRDLLEAQGGQIVRDVVEHPGAVAFLPETPDGYVVLVDQYRHPVGGRLLEAPAGTLEPGEDPVDCVRRELREETGYYADDVRYLGEVYLAPGYSSERIFLYHVQVSRSGEASPEPDEDIRQVKLKFEELLEMAASGSLRDAKTVALVLLVAAAKGMLQGVRGPAPPGMQG